MLDYERQAREEDLDQIVEDLGHLTEVNMFLFSL